MLVAPYLVAGHVGGDIFTVTIGDEGHLKDIQMWWTDGRTDRQTENVLIMGVVRYDHSSYEQEYFGGFLWLKTTLDSATLGTKRITPICHKTNFQNIF